MKTPLRALRRLLCALVLAAAGMLSAGTVAHAQVTKIFVASYGNDANDGSRGSPKRNFQAAHDAVAVGGQIVVLDTAGYGTLSINKSLSVTVPPGVNGFITASGANSGIIINSTDGNDIVSLRGLIIEGGSQAGGSGIIGSLVRVLEIEDCTIRNFAEVGIDFGSPVSNATLTVRHGIIRNCGIGLRVNPIAGNTGLAVVNDCLFRSNDTGVRAEAGGIATFQTSDITLNHCDFVGQTVRAISSANNAATVRVNDCNVVGNNLGYTVESGGQVLSRGNNTLESNVSGNNTFPGTYSPK